MTESKPASAPARLAPAGLMFLAITSLGWGFNWPVTKYLVGFLPPLTLRGGTGVIGAGALAALASLGQQGLKGEQQLCRAALAAGLRDRADRLHHAGLGGDAGLAGARRAADRAAQHRAGDGVRWPCL